VIRIKPGPGSKAQDFGRHCIVMVVGRADRPRQSGAVMENRLLQDLIRHRTPISLPPQASVQEACRTMRDRRVGCVVVAEAGRPVGIFTGRDAIALLAEGRDPVTLTLADAMTPRPYCLGPEATALDALRCMQDGGFRHVPIVEDGVLVAVVSRGDFRAVEHARLNEETGYWERL
jgi:CBS domain-containing protein